MRYRLIVLCLSVARRLAGTGVVGKGLLMDAEGDSKYHLVRNYVEPTKEHEYW